MKGKKEDDLKVGDEVLTDISPYKGRVTAIETRKRDCAGYISYSTDPVTYYSVSLWFPCHSKPEFKMVLADFQRSELRKP